MNSISLFMVINIYEYGINTNNGIYVCNGSNEYPTADGSGPIVK